VRGWENRLLGPKVPDIRFSETGDTLVDGYVPLGGFARATFSVELQFPLLGPNIGMHMFLDGGRVWTDDARFGMDADPYGQEETFTATGAGLDFRTPVGPIKLGVGYKLNPSITDLVDAEDLFRAANAGTPHDTLERHQSRRWQWYLAIGSSY
jgi:outer membrane protein assembly factor BamA